MTGNFRFFGSLNVLFFSASLWGFLTPTAVRHGLSMCIMSQHDKNDKAFLWWMVSKCFH